MASKGKAKKAPTAPAGRPTKYKPEFDKLASDYTELGATLPQIAKFLGVDAATITRWMESHPSFCAAIKETRELADSKVEQSLYKRACGLVKTVERPTKDGGIVTLKEEVPPDTAAAFIWLKNRRPKEWRDKQEVEHRGELKIAPALQIIDPTKE